MATRQARPRAQIAAAAPVSFGRLWVRRGAQGVCVLALMLIVAGGDVGAANIANPALDRVADSVGAVSRFLDKLPGSTVHDSNGG
ncbi:hypothetical protein [Yinghuangia seranimata]|uniref:hypothetical protein n=1 Tax=Yinghuangia seranimata TaxID=408067 RepID=UPI00248B2C20|nr:hypothetical protein [Yinghuangia seranimata]MDI2130844.1 hypothetical protein [Yinghuangia seranimata]